MARSREKAIFGLILLNKTKYMRRILISVIVSSFMISCSFISDEEYTPEFHQPLPFLGMKGNIMSVEREVWDAAIVNNDTILRKDLSRREYLGFTEKGLLDSSMTKVEYTPSSVSITTYKYKYKKNQRVESVFRIFNHDKYSSDTIVSKVLFKRVSKEREERYLKVFSRRKGIELDTIGTIVDYDFKNKKMTVKHLIDRLGNANTTSYMDDHLVVKQISEYPDRAITANMEYDSDGNLKMVREDRPEGTIRVDYKYLKYDEYGNWIERLLILGSDKMYFETNEISYRK